MTGGLPDAELARILDAVETVDSCLEHLVETRNTAGREAYRSDPSTEVTGESPRLQSWGESVR